MKATITITKQEIEEAVKRYIDDRIRPGYSHEFTGTDMTFGNKEGNIGYFECFIDVVVEPESKKATE